MPRCGLWKLLVALSTLSFIGYTLLWFYSDATVVLNRKRPLARLEGRELRARVPPPPRASQSLAGYLIPVVRGGANNQLGDIASAITVAAKLHRDVILPPLQGHKTEAGGSQRSQHLTDVWNVSQLDTGDSYRVSVHALEWMKPKLKTLDMAFVGCVTKRLSWKITVGPQLQTAATVPVSIAHWGDLEAKSVQCFDDNVGVKQGSVNGSLGVAAAFADSGVTAFPVILVSWGHLRHRDRKREVVHLLRSVRFTNDILVAVDAFLRDFGLLGSDSGVRPYIGLHARRGDFETYCNKAKFNRSLTLRSTPCRDTIGVPIMRNRTTCFPSTTLIGSTVNEVASLRAPACVRNAHDMVVATNEAPGTAFWSELEQVTMRGQSNLSHMHSFTGTNATIQRDSRHRVLRVRLGGVDLSPLQQSVVEQGVMIRSCAFVGNIASTWSRLVMHYREAWQVSGTCRYVGHGMGRPLR